jgi:hypothetical protein
MLTSLNNAVCTWNNPVMNLHHLLFRGIKDHGNLLGDAVNGFLIIFHLLIVVVKLIDYLKTMEEEEGLTFKITRLNHDDEELLCRAGFVKQQQQQHTWSAPSGCTMVTKRPRYDLFDITIFYGDTSLLEIRGKDAFYNSYAYPSVHKENIEAFIRGELQSARGIKVEQAITEALEASEEESKRQQALSRTDPDAYMREGLIALMNKMNE